MTQPLLLAMPDSDIAPVTTDAIIHVVSRNDKGRISELEFEKQATLRGWSVATPRAGAKDFDCIIKRPTTRPLVIQIKKATSVRSGQSFYITCCQKPPNQPAKPYSAQAFDVLAAHLYEPDEWIFYKRSELGQRTTTSYTHDHLRATIKKSACDARDPNNWHLLDEVAESLTPTQ